MCSQRVNGVQKLRHSLLRADRLLEKHEDEVGGWVDVGWMDCRRKGGGRAKLWAPTGY